LARSGYRPVVYDNLSRGHRWAVKWGPLVEKDLGDRVALSAALETYRPVAVLHFAAYAYVGESMAAPGLYYRNNLVESLNLLECMQAAEVGTIVFSSTCATYGVPQKLPIADDHPQNPISPYGETKRANEQALRWYGEAHGLKWAALRYFNAAGGDPDGELGEAHSPETHLIPLAIEAALGQRSHVDIFGEDYETDDGTAVRDFIHVTDLAEAHVRALDYLRSPLGESRAFNLGTGSGYSVRQVLDAVEAASGARHIGRSAPRRPGDPPELVADASAAMRLLDWAPQHSSLTEIVDTALSWHRRFRATA
jgi:UDP-arabinose 4-epimerase